MARVMLSAGMFASRAARTADRSRALWSGSPPPMRAATVTSRISLVNRAPLLAPIASFLRLIFVHRLWPDILRLLDEAVSVDHAPARMFNNATSEQGSRVR